MQLLNFYLRWIDKKRNKRISVTNLNIGMNGHSDISSAFFNFSAIFVTPYLLITPEFLRKNNGLMKRKVEVYNFTKYQWLAATCWHTLLNIIYATHARPNCNPSKIKISKAKLTNLRDENLKREIFSSHLCVVN